MGDIKKQMLVIDGEPIPKSTKKPPRVRKEAQYHIMKKNPESWKDLIQTWEYQKLIADQASLLLYAYDKDDPIVLSIRIYKSRRMGDSKNFRAAIEDGLQGGKIIPNDKQVTMCFEVQDIDKKNPRAVVELSVDPRIFDVDWVMNWFGYTRNKAIAYMKRKGTWHGEK